MIGEAAVPGVVAFDIGVEQEDGDDVTGDTNDIEAPGADEDLTALHGEGDELVGAGKCCLGRPGNVGFGLLADVGELLAEVTAAMNERDGNHRGGGICRGTKRVAGQHAETTGVGGQRRGECNLHGKVSDAAKG